MKKLYLIIIILLSFIPSFAQKKVTLESTPNVTNKDVVYKLFPTQNMWTFLKLNTRNGQIWQVQFDVEGSNRFSVSLNPKSLIAKEFEEDGRFLLHPTQNMYTFILLDQVNGNLWQVQWSQDANNRGIMTIE